MIAKGGYTGRDFPFFPQLMVLEIGFPTNSHFLFFLVKRLNSRSLGHPVWGGWWDEITKMIADLWVWC